jgi:hypothetical protein
MKRAFLVCVLGMGMTGFACGGSSSSNAANPCATKGATYLATFTEVSGNCGPVPSQVVNINPDGTITSSVNETCGSVSQQGCTGNRNDCTWSSQGYNFLSTSSVTFSSDGTSASGIATISVSGGGQSCTETYSLSYARQ